MRGTLYGSTAIYLVLFMCKLLNFTLRRVLSFYIAVASIRRFDSSTPRKLYDETRVGDSLLG
jgi:hypothetical protein